MVPTEEWVEENFFKYNRIYFNGELPTPRIIVSEDCTYNGEDCFGYYSLFGCRFDKINRKIISLRNNGTLCISSKYDRPEKDIIGTLLHEMIHVYVNLCLLVYPKNPHGKEFTKMANKINADGWDISESNEMGAGFVAGSGGSDGSGSQPVFGILCLIYKPTGTDYKYWFCRAEPNQFDAIRHTASTWGSDIQVHFYQTKSSKLMSLEANVATLPGFGSMNVNDAIRNLANFLGESIDVFSTHNLQKIN